jgi:hypothetical protein
VLVLVAFVIVESGYFTCLYHLINRSDLSSDVQKISKLDIITLPVLLSFWFVTPLHTALGYLNKSSTLEACGQSREKLLSDRRARFFVQFAVFFSLVNIVAVVLVWISVWDALDVSFALFRPYAVFSIVVRVVTVYAHFLLIALAARSIQIRLEDISTELGNTLDAIQPRINGVSALELTHTPTIDQQLMRWSDAYTSVSQDIGTLSERFSVRMVLAVFLFFVATTNIISSVWEDRGEKLSEYQTILVLALYVPNAAMILLSISPMSFPYTMCTQDIGQKLVALAMRIEEVGQTPAAKKFCPLLANAFLLAPVELICGNFELAPSVSNAIAGVLIALFLLVLGYKSPA